jgi:hypothetical protein
MKTYTGINIQYPISRLILEGTKTIETRTYPIPKKFIGKELVFIETPGKQGNFKSRAIAIIKFDESFLYKSKDQFLKDITQHRVESGSKWAWDDSKQKWGWPIIEVKMITPKTIKNRLGIKYTNGIKI